MAQPQRVGRRIKVADDSDVYVGRDEINENYVDEDSVKKSGWLWQWNSVEQIPKLTWAVLWDSGRLMFYRDDQEEGLEDHIYIPMAHVDFLGPENIPRDVQPPAGFYREQMFGLVIHYLPMTYYFCPQSVGDRGTWIIALQEAMGVKATSVHVIPGWSYEAVYGGYIAGPFNHLEIKPEVRYRLDYMPNYHLGSFSNRTNPNLIERRSVAPSSERSYRPGSAVGSSYFGGASRARPPSRQRQNGCKIS